MTPDLPVAEPWFAREEVEPGVTRIHEPHVDHLIQANMWHVRGRDRDLLIDGGMGIVPLRPAFPDLWQVGEPLALATHTHVDHVGAMHEFDDRAVHAIEAEALAKPARASLLSADMGEAECQIFVAAGYAPLKEYLIEALPHPWYDVNSYRIEPAPATRILQDGDMIDLGDRQFQVLLLPGHSPGGVALWEASSGTLFAGDVIYDGPLLYEGEGTDVGAYIASFRRLRGLPVRRVHAGHEASFAGERMLAIIDTYLARWGG